MMRPIPRSSLLALGALLAGCSSSTELPQCQKPTGDCPQATAVDIIDPLQHLGRAPGPTFIEIVDVLAAGDLVYACTGTKGLTIYDAAADDGPPTTLADKIGPKSSGLADSSFPRCQHVHLDEANQRVVITNRGDEIQPAPWLFVYDVSDPTAVREIGGWTPAASIEGAIIEGTRVYAAMHTAGITIIDDDGTGTLVGVGAFSDDDSDAWQVVKTGTTLVAAEGATGLRTYDVSGDEPVLLATVPLEGSSRDLVVRDDIAYVANSGGIATVDISDPGNPTLLGQLDVDGTSLGIALGAGSTVVTAEWDEVRGYDVSDPANPVPIFSETVPSDDTRSRVLGIDADPERNRVYAGEWRGLHAYEQRTDGTGPEIFVSPQTVQFGVVPAGESEARVVIVGNQGDQPLTIFDIVGGSGLSTSEQCLQIAPGAAAAVEVRVEPDNDAVFGSGIKFCSDDPDESEHTIDVSANVPGIAVGDRVPQFELTDQNGEVWSPSRLRGKVAVLAYFATF